MNFSVTHDSLTNEQILALRDIVREADNVKGDALCRLARVGWLDDIERWCSEAMGNPQYAYVKSARMMCARLINDMNPHDDTEAFRHGSMLRP